MYVDILDHSAEISWGCLVGIYVQTTNDMYVYNVYIVCVWK